MRPRAGRCLRATIVPFALGVCLVLSGCGGSGHHHHRHRRHHHPSGGGTANVPHEVVGTPHLAPIAPGRPGLEDVRVSLPAPSAELTASSFGGGQTAAHAFSQRITAAPANAVVHLASGSYPQIYDVARRKAWVTVSGQGDATKPVIAGAELLGAEHVRFVDVKFTKKIKIAHVAEGGGQALHASDIAVIDSELDCGAHGTVKGKVGVGVRGAAQNVELSGDYIHNCVVGFTSAASDNYSKNITITHCLFEAIYGDAIDLGGIDGMEIANDVIRDVHRTPGHKYHDDGIQFFGNTANVIIAYNVEANSTDQLVFIQDAVKNKFNGSSTNQDVLVLGNLIYGAGALAVQDQGALDSQFIGNTIWDNKDGSLLIRKSPYSHIVPTHTLVADNIIEGFSLEKVPQVVQGYNVFDHAPARVRGGSDLSTASPGFTGAADGVFALSAGSPAKGSAAPSATLVKLARSAGANAAALTLIGAYRASDRGAIIADSSLPSLGAPDTSYAGAN